MKSSYTKRNLKNIYLLYSRLYPKVKRRCDKGVVSIGRPYTEPTRGYSASAVLLMANEKVFEPYFLLTLISDSYSVLGTELQ